MQKPTLLLGTLPALPPPTFFPEEEKTCTPFSILFTRWYTKIPNEHQFNAITNCDHDSPKTRHRTLLSQYSSSSHSSRDVIYGYRHISCFPRKHTHTPHHKICNSSTWDNFMQTLTAAWPPSHNNILCNVYFIRDQEKRFHIAIAFSLSPAIVSLVISWWLVGWVDGWMDVWMDGLMDGCNIEQDVSYGWVMACRNSQLVWLIELTCYSNDGGERNCLLQEDPRPSKY